jgi:hypothetical protein
MSNDSKDFLSKPSKSVEEFAAKQVYISERLNQQPPATPLRMLLRCFLSSLLTAALVTGAIALDSLMEANRLREHVSTQTPAARVLAPTPAPKQTNYFEQFAPTPAPPAPRKRDITAEQFLDSPLSGETWVPFESVEFSFTAAFPSQPSVEPITGNWAVGKIFASTRDGDREGVIVFANGLFGRNAQEY